MARYIFVTGGVVSSLGKGLSSASLAYLLKSRGYNVKIRKLDPYLNVDPGTMNPFQHGEVFVTNDGAETDLDLGHYERFTDINSTNLDNITTGKIYSKIIDKERLDSSSPFLGFFFLFNKVNAICKTGKCLDFQVLSETLVLNAL